jgi:nucleoid-associated protein YgaU
MGPKAKIFLLVLMVGLVAAIFVWDKYFKAGDEKEKKTASIPVKTTQPDHFADLSSRGPGLGSGTPSPGTPASPSDIPPLDTTPAPPGPSAMGDSLFGRTDTGGGTKPPTDGGGRSGLGGGSRPFDSSPTPPPPPPPPGAGKTYKVQENDNLWSIAEKFYKNGTKMNAIRDANNMKDGELLKVGRELVIPDVAAATPAPGPDSAREGKPKETPLGPGEYRVKEGDILWSIAESQLGNGAHWQLIFEANKEVLKDNPNRLKTGMVLSIPPKPEKKEKPAVDLKGGKKPELKEEPVPAELAGKRTYRIKSGDSLWKIAEKELGNGMKMDKIWEANKGRLKSKTDLTVGTLIVLPEESAEPPRTDSTRSTRPAPETRSSIGSEGGTRRPDRTREERRRGESSPRSESPRSETRREPMDSSNPFR